ncbi:MAG: EAL domain-containing protein, partial [Bacteroidales bacterium]
MLIVDFLKSQLESDIIIGRIDEHRFFIAMDSNKNSSFFIATTINKFNSGFYIDNIPMPIKTSIAVVNNIPPDRIKSDLIFSSLENTLTEARKIPGNSFFISDLMTDNKKTKNNIEIINSFSAALNASDIIAVYQPKIDSRTGHVYGAEALCRWRRDGRLLTPGAFMPIIEDTALMVSLDKKIITDALIFNRHLYECGIIHVMSVNVSFITIISDGFLDFVINLIDLLTMPPSLIEIEILETTSKKELSLAQAVIKGLSSIGVRIALDDFGTGASSLLNLTTVHYDVIKIDRSIVQGLTLDKTNNPYQAIIESLQLFTHGLSKDLVIEGVETQ